MRQRQKGGRKFRLFMDFSWPVFFFAASRRVSDISLTRLPSPRLASWRLWLLRSLLAIVAVVVSAAVAAAVAVVSVSSLGC